MINQMAPWSIPTPAEPAPGPSALRGSERLRYRRINTQRFISTADKFVGQPLPRSNHVSIVNIAYFGWKHKTTYSLNFGCLVRWVFNPIHPPTTVLSFMIPTVGTSRRLYSLIYSNKGKIILSTTILNLALLGNSTSRFSWFDPSGI